jgi:hypothetical protein
MFVPKVSGVCNAVQLLRCVKVMSHDMMVDCANGKIETLVKKTDVIHFLAGRCKGSASS